MSEQWATMTIRLDGNGFESRIAQDDFLEYFGLDHVYAIESLDLNYKTTTRQDLLTGDDVKVYDFSATKRSWNRAGLELGY